MPNSAVLWPNQICCGNCIKSSPTETTTTTTNSNITAPNIANAFGQKQKKKRIKIVMTKQMKINEPTNAEASDERGLGVGA